MHLNLIYTIKILRKHLLLHMQRFPQPPFSELQIDANFQRSSAKHPSASVMAKPLKRQPEISESDGELGNQKKSTTSPSDETDLMVTPGPLTCEGLLQHSALAANCHFVAGGPSLAIESTLATCRAEVPTLTLRAALNQGVVSLVG